MYPIKLTNKQIQEAVETIRKQLKSTKITGGTLKFEYTLTSKNTEKTTLKITKEAWKKIEALVDGCNKEIAWHGTVTKDKNVYTIEDIVVFPQTVTAATVTTDETNYSLWLAQQPNEVFNKLRFHGHSHVNMGVSPSGVDLQYQSDMLQNLNDFYIFAIFNKRGANWTIIYDVTDNIVYEDNDIILDIEEDPIAEWATQQMLEKVVDKPPVVKTKPTATIKKSVQSPGELMTKETTKEKSLTDEIMEDIRQHRQQTFDDYYRGYYGGRY